MDRDRFENDGGDTEVAFLYAFFLWSLSAILGWLTYLFYKSWEQGEPYLFTTRKTEWLNILPSYIHFLLVLIVFIIMICFSIKPTIKFIQLFRT
ncbi:hypothetical protein [Pseudocolwellia sp. HL-MZ7]|uniref:hypothetical protein n=1 Tax=Pseudocolwellia sp. HL-MZ7 TaxID=3400627 RepID=UPI003CF1BEA4